MNKNKLVGIVLSGFGLLLSLVILFCLEQGYTPTLWITFGFVVFAYLASLIFQLLVCKDSRTSDEQFLHIPALLVSAIYELSQIPICVIFALGSSLIPAKIAVLVNAVVLLVAWTINVSSIAGTGHMNNVNSRQKDHHVEL